MTPQEIAERAFVETMSKEAFNVMGAGKALLRGGKDVLIDHGVKPIASAADLATGHALSSLIPNVPAEGKSVRVINRLIQRKLEEEILGGKNKRVIDGLVARQARAQQVNELARAKATGELGKRVAGVGLVGGTGIAVGDNVLDSYYSGDDKRNLNQAKSQITGLENVSKHQDELMRRYKDAYEDIFRRLRAAGITPKGGMKTPEEIWGGKTPLPPAPKDKK